MYCTEYQVKLDKENFLGKGLFTQAYRVGERVVLTTEDMAKECIATFCQIGNKHIPALRRLDNIGDKQAYTMPYYRPLLAQNKVAWSQMKSIDKIMQSVPFEGRKKYICFENFLDAFKKSTLPEELKEALHTIVESMMNYSEHIFLEISPRNAKVDGNGNLILLDIIGDSEQLKEKFDGIRKNRR